MVLYHYLRVPICLRSPAFLVLGMITYILNICLLKVDYSI
jgi:hypothetical protein